MKGRGLLGRTEGPLGRRRQLLQGPAQLRPRAWKGFRGGDLVREAGPLWRSTGAGNGEGRGLTILVPFLEGGGGGMGRGWTGSSARTVP